MRGARLTCPGGYHYFDNQIRGFSQTHMVGPGASDYGNIGIMFVGKLDGAMTQNFGYLSTFSHGTFRVTSPHHVASEKTEPGYYSVHLDTPGMEMHVFA